jgi:WD40 repeat protein
MGSPVVLFYQKNYQFTNKRTSFIAEINTNASLEANIEYVERNGSEETLIATEENWLSYSLQDGGKEYRKQLVLTAQANTNESPRYARVIVKDIQSVTTDTIHIEQLETDVFRVVDGDSPFSASYVLPSYKAGTVNFYIDSNVKYIETISPDCADWITKNTTKFAREELSYNVAESEEFDTREGTITLARGNEEIVLTIQQPGHPMFTFYTTTRKTEITDVTGIDCDGIVGENQRKVKYWTNFADFSIISNNSDWIPQESLQKGKDGASDVVCFQVSKNNGEKRSGSIKVTCEGDNNYNKTLNIVQNQFEARADINRTTRTMFLGYDEEYSPLYILDDETSSPNFEYESIEWTSSDEDVATVDADGKVKVVDVTQSGKTVTIKATITLKPGYRVATLEKTCTLTVADAYLYDDDDKTKAKVEAVELVVDDPDLAESILVVNALNFTSQSVAWKSNNPDIAGVKVEDGKCTIGAVNAGETTVEAIITTGDTELPTITLTCKVKVTTPSND